MCVHRGGGFLKGFGGRGAYKNDNALQDGSFYGFALFFMCFFNTYCSGERNIGLKLGKI